MPEQEYEDDPRQDGCEIDFDDPEQNTQDGEQVDALVMFADCWDDPDAVEQRKAELQELSDAGFSADA